MARILAKKEPLIGHLPDAHSVPVEDVYRAHAQTVARWAHRLGGPGIGVEDVVQEVFVNVHRALPRFRGDSNLSTWLFRITENVVRQRRRKDRLRRFLGGTAEEVAGDLPSTDRSPIELIEQREARDRVYRVLDRMSDRYRSVLVLFEIEQLSGEQIATLKNAKVATVWVWLHRARAEFTQISEQLAQEEPS